MSAQTQLGDWKERYKGLSPFEKHGVIQVGGRWTHSLFYDNDQPVLLPTEHIISKLVVKDAEYDIRHAGRESTLCETRRSILLLEEETRLNKLSRTA